ARDPRDPDATAAHADAGRGGRARGGGDPGILRSALMSGAALIERLTAGGDWQAARPLGDRALAAYAEHGCLLLKDFASAALLQAFRDEAATLIGLVLDELRLGGRASAVDRSAPALALLVTS